jgi:hypothetical protein
MPDGLLAEEILVAIRDVLENAHGSARTITSGTYLGQMHEALAGRTEAVRALVKPRAEARIVETARHPQALPEPGNVQLVALTIEVRIVRVVAGEVGLKDDLRDEVRGLAAEDGDVLRRALGFPGNLAQTAAAAATGLVSGMLRYQRSAAGPIAATVADGVSGMRIETRHLFTGTARVTQ